MLAAAYPAGAIVGALPSGIVAARLGVKPTVLVGMTVVALTTALFGLATEAWQLDLARFCQGIASAFSWTGALAWLVAAAPAGRRGTLIGQAFAAAVGGALLGPVLGGIAAVAGTGCDVRRRRARVARRRRVGGRDAGGPARTRRRGSTTLWRALARPARPARRLVRRPAGAPLRDARPCSRRSGSRQLGFGSIAIGATWLVAGCLETVNNVLVGRLADRRGPLAPIRVALVASAIVAALLPWPDRALVLAVLVVCAGLAFGAFYTPGMTLLTHAAEDRGLDYGYAFALVNLAWAPGQTAGAALGGAVAEKTSDAVPYLTLSALCAPDPRRLWRSGSSS